MLFHTRLSGAEHGRDEGGYLDEKRQENGDESDTNINS